MRTLRNQNKSEPKPNPSQATSDTNQDTTIKEIERSARSSFTRKEIKNPLSKKKSIEKKKQPSELEILKSELSAANERIKLLSSNSKSFTKNEDKLMSAIRTEKVAQNNDWPIISTNKLRNTYKIHPAYFSKSLRSLIDKKIIQREKVKYSGNVTTYKYSMVNI